MKEVHPKAAMCHRAQHEKSESWQLGPVTLTPKVMITWRSTLLVVENPGSSSLPYEKHVENCPNAFKTTKLTGNPTTEEKGKEKG